MDTELTGILFKKLKSNEKKCVRPAQPTSCSGDGRNGTIQKCSSKPKNQIQNHKLNKKSKSSKLTDK